MDVVAQGVAGAVTGRIQIVIYPLSLTSNLNPPEIQIGNSFSYQIQAGNSPTSFSASGLPPGLSIDTATGIISGVSTSSGTFSVTVRAQGPLSVAEGILRIVIAPPRITSTLNLTVELGGSVSYQITATHNPSSFAATGLPSSLQFNPSTGLITGTLNSTGTFSLTLIAHTAFGDAIGQLYVHVPAPHLTGSTIIPAIDIGSQVAYQITASHNPTSFAATGLPAGLTLDATTGRISGVAELSGNFQFQVTARGALGDAVGTLSLRVNPLQSIIVETPPTIMPLNIRGSIVADPFRSRIYVLTDVGVAVIDSESLTLLQTIPVGGITQGDLSVSLNGSKLWVVGISTNRIRSLDLNTLAVLPELTASQSPKHIREGADGYLYISDYNFPGVFQIDPNTGETRARYGDNSTATAMAMSRDGKDLYLMESNSGFFLSKYRLASGAAPALAQRSQTNVLAQALDVSPDGQRLALLPGNVSSQTVFRSTADLNVVLGILSSSFQPTKLTFSPDGAFAYQGTSGASQIDVFQTATRQLMRTTTLPGGASLANIGYGLSGMVVNRESSRVFLSASRPTRPHCMFIL